MANSKRTSRVGYIEYTPANIKLEKKYDNKDNMFRAVYGGTTYEDKDGAALETTILKAITDSLQVEWYPVLTLTVANGYRSDEKIGIEAERLYMADVRNKGLVTVHWDATPERRLLASHTFEWSEKRDGAFQLPTLRINHYGQTSVYYYAYTEELWQQTQDIQEAIKRTRTALLYLLTKPELLAEAPHALFAIRKTSDLITQK